MEIARRILEKLRSTKWRAVYVPVQVRYGILILILIGIVTGGAVYRHNQAYVLSASELKLVGKTSVEQKLIHDTENTVSYNREEETDAHSSKTITLASPADSTGIAPYKADLSKDHQAGISFSDANDEVSFKMVPQFETSTGKYRDGHLVFPEGSDRTHVYTFKRNGVKEDILLAKSPGDTAKYSWNLVLNNTLEARLLPDGGVGIYGANPLLYGGNTNTDAASQRVIEKARANSEKTNLIFVLPAPYIKDSNGKTNTKDVSFKLEGSTLILEAREMDSKAYPLTIDPSVVITTTADFRTATDDGMINYATANQIGRSAISTGSVGATTRQTNIFTNIRHGHSSVVYNDYLYIIGGSGAAYYDDVIRCAINSGGSIGTCTQQSGVINFGFARAYHASAVYNGFLYVIGGTSGSDFESQNDIIRCPIQSNGSVGTCLRQTNAFTTVRTYLSSEAYNGFLYILGGYSSSPTGLNDIHYCPINADGSIGTCVQQTSAFTSARHAQASAMYNGYLYIIGGYDGTTNYDDIQYCPIQSNGSVGTCVQQTAAFTTARKKHKAVAYNGYLYITAGQDAGFVDQNDIQYCPIYANGSVGTCTQQTNIITLVRRDHTSVVYNGYLYVAGGSNSGTNQNDIQRFLISTGTPSGFGAVGTTTQQNTTVVTARNHHATAVYNGYIYVVGGLTGATGGGVVEDDIQYCQISSSGSVSACVQQTNAFTTARVGHTVIVYDGYLYIIGGVDVVGGSNRYNDIQYCEINADGSVDACTVQSSAFTGARAEHSSVEHNGYLYIVGGTTGTVQNDIQYCQIQANHSVGSCTQQTAAFTTARSGHASSVYNNYLYIVGGTNGTAQNDVQYCLISAGGSVGSCTQQTGAFTTARTDFGMETYNGFMYIAAGTTGLGALNDVQYCPINSGGNISACTAQAGVITSVRASLSSEMYNGFLYIIAGGATASTARYDDVQRLPTRAPDLSGRYERTIDITRVAESLDTLTINGTTNCEVHLTYAAAGTDYIFGSTTSVLRLVPGTAYSFSGVNSKRYLRLNFELDDSRCGSAATITDITLAYTTRASTPTLSTPLDGATTVSTLPVFTFRAPDPENNYLRYKFEVCTTSNCSVIVRTIDQTSSQTGWSGQDQQTGTAYTGNAVIASSTMATHTYQAPALNVSTQYWWRAYAIDPSDTNTWSLASATQTFYTQFVPAAPTLEYPANSATGISQLPIFELRSSDSDSDYLQYRFQLCANSDCSSIINTYDQTSSQTNWSNQNAGTGSSVAYSSGQVVANSQIARYRLAAGVLAPLTQYWWRGYAIDPAGTNTWSAASAISTFTTGQRDARIMGGTTIMGNTRIFN